VAIHFNINHGSFNKRFAPGGTGLPRRGFDLLAVTNTSIIVIASAAWRSIAEPPLHRHRERSVAIQCYVA